MTKIKKIISEINGERLDKYLVDQLSNEINLSRSAIQKLISSGNILVNDQIIKIAKRNVEIGDIIQVILPEPVKSELIAENLDLELIYEDDYLVIVNKPNNMVIHPGSGNTKGTLVHGLLAQLDGLSSLSGEERPGIVHRLDKQTTGLVIVAKDDNTHKLLSEMFANREIYKEYLALIDGIIPEKKGSIDAPIGRHETDRKKMTVTSKRSKKAISDFEVLERYDNATLVKVVLQTGRTHQIRVHFRFINHPILNDPLYSTKKEDKTDFGQYLHSFKLRFIHPITKRKMFFESPMPQEFNDKIKELRSKKIEG